MTEGQKKFLENFNPENPNWENLPAGFFAADLGDLTGEQISQFNIIKTFWELREAEIFNSRPKQLTRAWNDPKGYQGLAAWQNAALLRVLVRKFTLTLPLKEHRLKAQLDDAARSVKRNIEEGFKRPTTSEYLQFIGFSQASLEEVGGDFRDCLSDGFIRSVKGSSLRDVGIDLSVFKGKIKGEPDDPNHPYYQPLKSLKGADLTYEIFLELINKTDWLLRKLVGSLEEKLIDEKRGYELAKAKVRDKLNWRK